MRRTLAARAGQVRRRYVCMYACMEKRTATRNFGRVELGRATHRQIDPGPLTYTHAHTPHRRTASPPAANFTLTCFVLSARSICACRPHPPAPTATNSSGRVGRVGEIRALSTRRMMVVHQA